MEHFPAAHSTHRYAFPLRSNISFSNFDGAFYQSALVECQLTAWLFAVMVKE